MASRTGWRLVLVAWAVSLALPATMYWNLAVIYGRQGLLIDRLSGLPPHMHQAVFAAIIVVMLLTGCLVSAIVLRAGSWPQRLGCMAPSLFFAALLVYLGIQCLSW